MKARFDHVDLLIRVEPHDKDYGTLAARFKAFQKGGESAMLALCPPAPVHPAVVQPSLILHNALFSHDIENRRAQGILNRSLKAARNMSAEARRDLKTAIEEGENDRGASIVTFINKYRVQLAQLLTSSQLAAVLEGTREVVSKVPELDEDLGEIPQPTFPLEENVHLPIIDSAAKELAKKNVLTRQVFDELDSQARVKAFTVAGVDAEDTLTKIRNVIADNVAKGADYESFKQEVLSAVDAGTFLSDSHMETVFRTNVQNAFSEGQLNVLQNPLVRSGFPYSAYDSIHDDRARKDHNELDKLGIAGTNIYRNDDPVFQMFRPPWDYGCRCSWTPLTIRQAAEKGIPEAKTWLETGIEPSDPTHVPMPAFQPPEGFQRAMLSAPMSVQLSMRPMVTFSPKRSITLAIRHAPAGRTTTIGGKTYNPGEFIPDDAWESATPEEKAAVETAAPAQEKVKPGNSQRIQSVLDAASKIDVTDEIAGKADGVDEDDYDEIESRMDSRQIGVMERYLDGLRDEFIDNAVSNLDIDEKEIAEEAGWSRDDIENKLEELFSNNEDNYPSPDVARRTYGVTAIESAIADLDEYDEEFTEKYRGTIESELESWKEQAERDIQEKKDEKEEAAKEEAGEQYDSDSDDKQEYLKDFYNDNPEIFEGVDVEQEHNKWYKQTDGDDGLTFLTESGAKYKVEAVYQTRGGRRVPDIQFSDASGSYEVTGAGEAFQVFGKVLPAIVSYIQNKDLEVATFSAAEKSRQKLYDRLVKSVATVIPGYFAAYTDVGGGRYYVTGKIAMKDALLESLGKTGIKPTILVEGIAASMDRHTTRWKELKPSLKESWFTSEGWNTPTNAALSISPDEYPRDRSNRFLDKYLIVDAANNDKQQEELRSSLPEMERGKLDRMVSTLQMGGAIYHPKEPAGMAVDLDGRMIDHAWQEYTWGVEDYDQWKERDDARKERKEAVETVLALIRNQKVVNKIAKAATANYEKVGAKPVTEVRADIEDALDEYCSLLKEVIVTSEDGVLDTADVRSLERASSAIETKLFYKLDAYITQYKKVIRADATEIETERLSDRLDDLLREVMECTTEFSNLVENAAESQLKRIDDEYEHDEEPDIPDEPEQSAAMSISFGTAPKTTKRYGKQPGPGWKAAGTSRTGTQIWVWGAGSGSGADEQPKQKAKAAPKQPVAKGPAKQVTSKQAKPAAPPKAKKPSAKEAVASISAIRQQGTPITKEQIGALSASLMTMTVAEINVLKKQLGVTASGTKAVMANKIAERALQATNAGATKQQQPKAAVQQPAPAKPVPEPAKAAPTPPVTISHTSDRQAILAGSYPALEPEQKQWIRNYCMHGYKDLNAQLRNGVPNDKLVGASQEIHKALAKAFAEVKPLQAPVAVRRELKIEDKDALEAYLGACQKSMKEGGLCRMAGYLSTTTSQKIDTSTSDDLIDLGTDFEGNIEVLITARKGLDVKHISAYGEEENEFLLDNNSNFRVSKIEENGGKFKIHMEHIIEG